MELFKESYAFKLSEKRKHEKIEDVFAEWKEGSFEGEFTMIDKKAENNIVFRYLVGKGGMIYVEVFKVGQTVHLKITEKPKGFLMPILFFIIGLLLFFFNSMKLGLLCISIGVFLLVFILIVFKTSTRKIQEIVLSKL